MANSKRNWKHATKSRKQWMKNTSAYEVYNSAEYDSVYWKLVNQEPLPKKWDKRKTTFMDLSDMEDIA